MIKKIYNKLYDSYGPQGWWPLLSLENNNINPTKTGSLKGYHPNNYSYPKTKEEIFEICIGGILTQNTSWENVEKALLNLKKTNSISPLKLLKLSDGKLKELIRQAGYYNQKARYLKEFTKFFISSPKETVSREELLNITGIGNETADSMLLYAYKYPIFVIDAYTRRIFSRLLSKKEKDSYEIWQEYFHLKLEKDYKMFQEFHALIVEHAKRYCQKKPSCTNCILKENCNFFKENVKTKKTSF